MATAIPYNPRRRAPWARPGAPVRPPEFLCPVCAEDLFAPDGKVPNLCEHVLLVEKRSGGLLCRDGAIQAMAVEAHLEAEARGGSAMRVLQERLGPDVIFYELIEGTGPGGRPEVVTIVVDLERAA
jgi:hypothetical protein